MANNLNGTMVITLNDDGSISINSQKVTGNVSEIRAELKRLSRMMGGELVEEKHLPGSHSHSHGGAEHHHHH